MTTTDTALLSIDGVTVGYGKAPPVLNDLALQVRAGEIVGLIGETGSGKTTLARAVLGLTALREGTISLRQTVISAYRGRALRALRQSGDIQYVFQDPLQSLDPDFTIFESLAEGLRVRGINERARLEQAVTDVLREVHLAPEFAACYPAQLSGGQRQRVVIARAIVNQPALLLLDEPVSALDASNRIKLLGLFRELASRRQIAQLFISHDLGSVAGISDRIVVLYRGRIVETGPPDQVLGRPAHPYTRLLVASAPSILRAGADRASRADLLDALATAKSS
ncbi:ABC transporter ATP-binding protein [Paraburkholderia xenovorans]|uniref:ABC transporter ATP-binding protein n=1 Tax=Paraburkholderia xenovorans TaxID=36873 RepID=UPI001558845C|nr:ABC transporter ATP-binding protein [Paraburkholderia xenovorans]NPT39139.1 ATP-binding cassette domain-containing protein [Paraburkholderia xenovorans]